MIYFVILNYGNVRKNKINKKLISHHYNMYHINDISQQNKCPKCKQINQNFNSISLGLTV